MSDNTPAPWPDSMAPMVRRGDARVLLNGNPPAVDCRILSEANYQLARSAVNAIESWKLEEADWKRCQRALEAVREALRKAGRRLP
jgi:hypothetical protein